MTMTMTPKMPRKAAGLPWPAPALGPSTTSVTNRNFDQRNNNNNNKFQDNNKGRFKCFLLLLIFILCCGSLWNSPTQLFTPATMKESKAPVTTDNLNPLTPNDEFLHSPRTEAILEPRVGGHTETPLVASAADGIAPGAPLVTTSSTIDSTSTSTSTISHSIDLIGLHSHKEDAATFSGGVMGVLTVATAKSRELRDFYRSTWMQEETRLGFRHLFLFDKPTNETHAEQEIYHDILYLNATHTGVAVKFGEKLALWLKYAHKAFPNASWVGKMDDDVAICPHNNVWRYIRNKKAPTMYLGFFHNNNKPGMLPFGMDHRMDEMLVVVGSELVKRISEREYCVDQSFHKCEEQNGLYDTNFGGTSLGLWLTNYQDVKILHMGSKFYFWALLPNVPVQLCSNRMLLHKADICRMRAVWNMTNDDGDLDPMICGGMQEFDMSTLSRGRGGA